MLVCTVSFAQHNDFKKFRFGGYGEILGEYLTFERDRFAGNGEGAPQKKSAEVSMPRLILAFEYKFSPTWIFSSEIEFEAGGTGNTLRYFGDRPQDLESEVKKGGEVVIEQFHLTKIFSKAAQLRVGSIIVPVGLTNAHHEPINFFRSIRPEGEGYLVPCTWHEVGLSFLGEAGDFKYEVMAVNGLDPQGFSGEGWISNSRQRFFEVAQFTSPAYAGRIEYSGIKGLRLGASGYYSPNTYKNLVKKGYNEFKGSVGIGSFDALYNDNGIIARANVLFGKINDIDAINEINPNKLLGYSGNPAASKALTYYAEVGYNVAKHFTDKYKLIPFINYEYYNTAQVENIGASKPDPRYKANSFTYGINYYPLPNLVIKADYTNRKIGDFSTNKYNPENNLGLSIGYVAWFVSK